MSKENARTQLKGSKNTYDPQVGAAAEATAATAKQAQDFSESYFKDYIAPSLEQMTKESTRTSDRLDAMYQSDLDAQKEAASVAREQLGIQKTAQGKLNDLTDQQLIQMKQQNDRYQQYGIPAEDAYYKMVQDYSAPEYEEQQARGALGDVRSGAASSRMQLGRQYSSMGIDPTSPAAIAAASDASVMNAAAEASAQNQARAAAKQLGMSLKSDAANFGRGGLSAATQIGQTAGQSAGQSASTAAGSGGSYAGLGLNYNQAGYGATTGAINTGATTLGALNSSAGVPLAGYGTAISGYGNNLSAYTNLQKQQMDINAQNAGGFGKFLGTAAGIAAKAFI